MGEIRIFHLEEEGFLDMVGSWGPPESDEGTDSPARGPADMASPLARLGLSWRKDPDSRFGQLVENVVRVKLPLDTLRFMDDADFLILLGEWERQCS